MNTGVSPKRTTADAELGGADALGAGEPEALAGGTAATTLTTGGALGGGGATGGGAGAFSGSALGGSGSGSGAEALGAAGTAAEGAAEAEACSAPKAEAEGAALASGRPETAGAAVPALAATDCACTLPPSSPITKHSPTLRNRSPPTRADVYELTEDLTLEPRASVTGLATASTIRLARTASKARAKAYMGAWKALPKFLQRE